MAELNMQGEHHVNTFLGHEKNKKTQKKHKPGRTLLLHACLDFSLIRCWPHLPNQKQSASGEAMRCKARALWKKIQQKRGGKIKSPPSTHVK